MRTFTFIAITLVSGAIAGTLLGLINQVLVEPFIDKAIGIETQKDIGAGEIIDPIQQTQYRLWQKGGEIVAGTILGISIGALYGIVFIYSKESLPGSNNKEKALLLAGMMFFILFLIPALKYPPNPPAVGDPKTIEYRQSLYITILAISGLSALVLAVLYRRSGTHRSKNIIIPLSYAIIIAAAYVTLPSNPDKVTIPTELITNFRVVSATTIGLFWILLGVIFGSFWDRFRPYERSRLTTI